MLFFAHVSLTIACSRFFGQVSLLALSLGSMLLDVIDKPLGLIVFGSLHMGRTLAHTLLFPHSLYVEFAGDIFYGLLWGLFPARRFRIP